MQTRQFVSCFRHFCESRELPPPLVSELGSSIERAEVEELNGLDEAFALIERKFDELAKNTLFVLIMPFPWGPASIRIQTRFLNDDLMSRIAAAYRDLAAAMYFMLREYGIDLFELAGIQPEETEESQSADPEDEETFERLMRTITLPDIKFEGPGEQS